MDKEKSLVSDLTKAAVLGTGAWWAAKKWMRVRRHLDLRGRVVLITGGSRGLGLALAREFTVRGATVAVCARDASELERAAEEFRQRGNTLHTYVCDLQNPPEIAELIRKVEAELGGIDVLINNAGLITVAPAENLTTDDYQRSMEVNFWAAVHTTMAVTPGMRARGGGRVVNIASIGGKMPVPHLASYCASKFALVGYSGAMRAELAKDGIVVTTVCPGLMRTGSPRNADFKGAFEKEYAWFSLGDAMPGFTMSASRAARLITDATVNGEAEIVIGLPAKIAAKSYGLAPIMHLELSRLLTWFLPSGTSDLRTTRKGFKSESAITRSAVRHLGHTAERDYNELG